MSLIVSIVTRALASILDPEIGAPISCARHKCDGACTMRARMRHAHGHRVRRCQCWKCKHNSTRMHEVAITGNSNRHATCDMPWDTSVRKCQCWMCDHNSTRMWCTVMHVDDNKIGTCVCANRRYVQTHSGYHGSRGAEDALHHAPHRYHRWYQGMICMTGALKQHL